MKITVILCTYNRCSQLANVLESLSASILPDSVEWEVLVVDNNSSDQTRQAVMDFVHRLPGHFRYVFEPHPGKSFALNTGVRQARGDVLAFVDDDVTVEPTWLRNLTLSLGGTEWAGTGGRTLPAQTFSRPRWLSPDLAGTLYAHFDLGDAPCELGHAPYGANMAFRKAMFEKYGGFRTDLGPSPSAAIPRPNEDTEFGRRLIAAGERLRYESSAVVYHPVVEDRLTKSYFLEWRFDYGRAIKREGGPGGSICGIPRNYFCILKRCGLMLPLRALHWALTFDPQERFRRKCLVWRTAGEIAEAYRQLFQARSAAISQAKSKFGT